MPVGRTSTKPVHRYRTIGDCSCLDPACARQRMLALTCWLRCSIFPASLDSPSSNRCLCRAASDSFLHVTHAVGLLADLLVEQSELQVAFRQPSPNLRIRQCRDVAQGGNLEALLTLALPYAPQGKIRPRLRNPRLKLPVYKTSGPLARAPPAAALSIAH